MPSRPHPATLESGLSLSKLLAIWDPVVKPMLTVADLERMDPQTLVLTVPQQAAYDIAAPETISWSVPAEATAGFHWYEAAQHVRLQPTVGSAKMLGSLMVRNTDAQMLDEEEVGLTVRLAGDTWVDAVDQGGDDTRDLLPPPPRPTAQGRRYDAGLINTNPRTITGHVKQIANNQTNINQSLRSPYGAIWLGWEGGRQIGDNTRRDTK